MSVKYFDCDDCGEDFVTDGYWWVDDFTDDGVVELAQAECPVCGSEVLE